MEISPVPRHRSLSGSGITLLVVVVLTPVMLLALLPTMFGLQRFVVASDAMSGSRAGSVDRGSVVFEREVASSELEVGDVITFEPPPGHGVDGLVTHRIVSISPEGLRTQGDARPSVDPWVLPRDVPTRSRVLFAVPYVGYPFLHGGGRWALLAGVAVSTAAATALLLGRAHRRPRTHPGARVVAD
ncbi:signal peptidase I [Nocardioides ferulae]|uniref:signal peptidase I n=1 Tax=Nocardioides ferulae TaxID=2340821 RepID=UPI000EAB7306|nr:signal peptidase I [Nocardioides ferulae]